MSMIAKVMGGGTLVGGRAMIEGPGAPTVMAEGFVVSVMNDMVASHGEGAHAKATIVTSSKTVFAMGRGVVRMGDVATCGDPVISASTVLVGA